MAIRRHRSSFPAARATLAALGTAVLLTACSGGGSGSDNAAPSTAPAPSSTSDGTTDGETTGATEADKGAACEAYRDLTTQVEAAEAEAQGITVSSEEDGKKITELKTKVSDLTEKADAAYALCYAEGVSPE